MKQIASRDNPLFKACLALAERRQARRETGRTLLDGEHLLDEAIKADIRPRQLIFSEAVAGTTDWTRRLPDVPAVSLAPSLFAKLAPVANPTGVLAVIDIPCPVPKPAKAVVLLEDIQDPGNLGALFRTAAAAGIEAVYLSKGCAEAWSPKALRGGQGGHFMLPIHEDADLVAVARGLPGTVYAAALRSPRRLYDLDLTGPVAFAFGNEGAGLSPALLAETEAFSIPMPGGVESLNVGAAAAIVLFERVRQLGVGSAAA